MARKQITRPEIYRAEADYNGGKLVVKYTNGKRAVLFVDGMDVHYATFNNTVIKLVAELETRLIKV